MKIDIATNTLYADDGRILKKMHCPKKADWQTMQAKGADKQCQHCDSTVYNTAYLSEQQMASLLKKHPKACLSVRLGQANCSAFSSVYKKVKHD